MCLKETKADGLMCAQGLLFNPALFAPFLSDVQRKRNATAQKYTMKLPRDCPKLLPHMRKRRVTSPYTSFSLSVARRAHASPTIDLVSLTHVTGRMRYTRELKEADRKLREQLEGRELSPPKLSASINVKKTKASQPRNSIASSSLVSTPKDVYLRFELAREYLAYAQKYRPCHPSVVQRHTFLILFDQFHANIDLFDALASARTLRDIKLTRTELLRRAESGQPHPCAKGDRGKKRTRYRDGSLAPPPWPAGGGGFHISGGSWEDVGGWEDIVSESLDHEQNKGRIEIKLLSKLHSFFRKVPK